MGLTPDSHDAPASDIGAIRAVCEEYIRTYVTGDGPRHERVYHPECVKRAYVADEESGVTELITLSPRVMSDHAAASGRTDAVCEVDVVVDGVAGDMASVRIYSCNWVDFAHVVRARGEWRLFHVTWRRRDAA